jgi:hypothetical protein
MSSPALWPIAAGAVLNVGRRATAAITEGLAFAAELAGPQAPPAPASENRPSALEEIKQRISQLAEQISQRLREAGLALAEPATIVSDGLAGLTVAGDIPQRAEVEEVLSTDILLERDFDRLAHELRDLTGDELQITVR